jgi:hypothetical protein
MATILQTWEMLSPAAEQKKGGRYAGASHLMSLARKAWVHPYTGRIHQQFEDQRARAQMAPPGVNSVMFSEDQLTDWTAFNNEARYNYSDIATAQLGSI